MTTSYPADDVALSRLTTAGPSHNNNTNVTLVPLINEILRTRYCTPGSIFLVEDIQTAPISKSGRWQVIQLLLGDGELCIQALLGGPLHRFVKTGEAVVGCYIRVNSFSVKRQEVPDNRGKPRQMVYLVLEDLIRVGWNSEVHDLWNAQFDSQPEVPVSKQASPHPIHQPTITDTAADSGAEPDDLGVGPVANSPQKVEHGKLENKTNQIKARNEIEDAFHAFEALTFPLKATTKPVQKEAKQPQNTTATSTKKLWQPVALQRDWHDPQIPLKLTTLRSIPHLPYAQNWSCNVLAIIASLSPVETSHLPPYRQRTARITDPSTSKSVHLTVFLDPENFDPRVGSSVLLVGVKNHRFDGGSLKKYANDASAGKWWFQDPWELTWCDVSGIKSWWSEVEKSRSS